MPFYEYQCQACGNQVEVLQKISDPPLKKCPECGKSKLTKLVSAPVFRLKGGGWYETDFKSDKENKRNLVEADKAETKSDAEAKPAAADKTAEKAEKPAAAESKPSGDAKPAASKSATKTASRRRSAPKKPPVRSGRRSARRR